MRRTVAGPSRERKRKGPPMSRLSDDDLDFLEGKRLRRMGIDPDGDPGEIAREVDRQYKAVRAKYSDEQPEADVPAVVEPQRDEEG